jgi:hypothetical protein
MNEPLQTAATPVERTNQEHVDAPSAVSPSEGDAERVPLEQASALLLKLGPVEALRVLSAMSDAVAKEVRAQNGDAEVARVWRSSSEGMAKLAASLVGPRGTGTAEALEDATEESDDNQDGQGDDEDEAEEEALEESESESTATPARAPRKERAKMRRMVAGMFDVTARVNVCRLREVNEMGGRGELVGRMNEQGIEQTEWPLALMTPERLHNLTRRRGGKYMFEWFGRDENGARVALGRSPVFKVQGEETKKVDAPPAPATAQSDVVTAILAVQKQNDERADRERERNDREKEREHELRKHRETLAAKERIERLNQQTRLAELQAEAAAEAPPPAPAGPQLNEAAVAAYIERLVSERFARAPAPTTRNPADELGIPKWLQEIGVNKDMLAAAKPLLKEQLANLPSLLAKMGVQGGPIATPPATTSPYPAASNVSRFVPKGGTGS